MAKPFVDQFIEFNKAAESPESFFRWAAYAAIGATLRDNVHLDLGVSRVWPNVYVILMARSAALRKSVPLKKVGALLLHLNKTKVILGRSSIQAVIRELGHVETNNKGEVQSSACGIIISEELSAFAPEDPATIPILTEIYDNHPEWTNRLVGQGKMVLKNTCVSLLAASNEPLFKQVYTSLALRGGLLGRTFIVRESKKSKVNSLMRTDIEDMDDWLNTMSKMHDDKELKDSLISLSCMAGRAVMDFDARVEYDKWYGDLQKKLPELTDESGVVDRIHTGILKIALIIAASSTYELCVRKCHIEESIERCTALLKSYEVLTMGSGKSQTAEPGAYLLAYLWERKGQEKIKRIIQMNWQHFDAQTLRESLIPTFVQGGIIEEKVVEGEAGLALTPKGREMFEKRIP